MFIRKLELLNFRQFRNAKIAFSEDDNRNVTVISGGSSADAVTISDAMKWLLYGESIIAADTINNKYIEQQSSGEGTIVSVTLLAEYNGQEYMIKRTMQNKKFSAQLSELRIAFKTEDDSWRYLTNSKKTHMISRILPRELSKFLFWDSERINGVLEEIAAGNNKEFRSTVYELMGLNAIENLMRHLKSDSSAATVVGRFEKKIFSNSMDNIRGERYGREIEKLRIQKEKLEKKIEDIKNNISCYEQREEYLNRIAVSEIHSTELDNRYKELIKDIAEYKRIRQTIIDCVMLPLSDREVYNFMAAPFVKEVFEDLDTIAEDDCSQITSIDCSIDNFKRCAKLISEKGDAFFDSFSAVANSVKEIDSIITTKTEEAVKISEQLADINVGESAKIYLAETRKSLAACRKELAESGIKLNDIDKDIEKIRIEKEKIVDASDNTRKLILCRAYAEKLYEDLLLSYRDEEKEAMISFVKSVNDILADIYDGEINMSLNDKYDIKISASLTTAGNDEREKMIQYYAVIFAFIIGESVIVKQNIQNEDLIKNKEDVYTEGDSFPLFIDVHLSAFDKIKVNKLFEYMSAAAKQVIIFIEDSETAGDYLTSVTGAKYIINKEDKLYSTVERG